MRNYIADIGRTIKERNLALFCGAGISKNSGLPLANELKKYVLEKLPLNQKEVAEVMDSTFPFEAFMESISESTDVFKILNLFADGQPNINHILVARLAKMGYLNTIFTTNFDLLIEEALKSEGLKENVAYQRYYDEEHFSSVDLGNSSDGLRIFKIHGTIDHVDSIRTTLEAVASTTLSDKRWEILRYLFSTGRHKKVLIVGYSASDEFDITPQIQSIRDNRKEIFFVEHGREEEIEDINENDFKNPFKEFSGSRIKCDTDKFIKELWGLLGATVGEECKLPEPEIKWRRYVDNWAEEMEVHKGFHKYFTAASIFASISDYSRSCGFYENSLEAAKAIGCKLRESSCYIGLGNNYLSLGDFKSAIEYFKKALKIQKIIGDKRGRAACYIGLHNACHRLGDVRNENKWYKKILEVAEANKKAEAVSWSNSGHTYSNQGNFKTAIRYYSKALEIYKEMGDKDGELGCYLHLGNTYSSLKDLKTAIEYRNMALTIAKSLGDKKTEADCYLDLVNAHDSLEDFKTALEYGSKALEIYKEMGDKGGESFCYKCFGYHYCSLKDFKRAVAYHEKSLEISKEIGDKAVESQCYIGLGIDYHGLGDFRRALGYCGEALKIKKAIGDKEGEIACYIALGNNHLSVKDFKGAVEDFLNAEKIIMKTGHTGYLKTVYNNLSLVYEESGDYISLIRLIRLKENLEELASTR
jgi:tetratricopeptide (TPR) repeat protein